MGLVYDEPWGWMVPAEHALGALLLEHGHVEEATSVFRRVGVPNGIIHRFMIMVEARKTQRGVGFE